MFRASLKRKFMSVEIVVLSAGLGTRMKSQKAKVLHKICGKEMIYHILKESKKITNNVGVVLYHQKEAVEEVISRDFNDIKITLQDMQNYPGTGGALLNYRFEGEKIVVLNGDMPLISESDIKSFFTLEADIVVGVLRLQDPSGYGRVVIREGEVVKIVEQKDANAEELAINSVNSGVYLFKKEVLSSLLPKLSNDNAQKEYYLTDVIELAKSANLTVKAIEVKESAFKGVNSKEDLANAEMLMITKKIGEFARAGVQFRLPHTCYIEEGVSFEGECEVEPNVVIKGNTTIVNSVIRSGSVIEDSYVKDSVIGCMAHLRPGSHIVDSHIGNFVETKQARINGAKANHLSYLGDCSIDSGSNIGAGTITCNYDGKKKYKTVIGKNVFIGSDTQLVAPLHIEDEVIIAAGTTVTKDVKKGSLAISRTPLSFKEGFFYRFFGGKG